jgi:outer membrane biogenesis lipoprotein LolB
MKAQRTRVASVVASVAVLFLSACTEPPQTAGTQHQGSKSWTGTQPNFNAPGWKPGDQASWTEEIKKRNRGQDDYVRITP